MNVRKKIIGAIALIAMVVGVGKSLLGQAYNWRKLRYEVYGGFGATNFMGDAGTPINKGLQTIFWVNPSAIRPVIQLGGRMALDPRQKVRVNLAVGMLYNDDRYGGMPDRFLHFRSPIVELGGIYEFYIIKEQQKRNRYRWLNLPKRPKRNHIPTYLFAGVAGIYFNPQAYTRGEWHNLRPLSTAGQGLPGYKDPYSLVSVAFPFGIGWKVKVAKYQSINFEAGWRLTLTDYIDDISADPFPPTQLLLDNRGEIAAILSYRYGGLVNEYTYYLGGGVRGGSWIDQYQFFTISYCAILKTDRKGRPKLEFY
ncbi:MAG TPA: hypothetical protein PK990_01365 [Salinivirgaceae bacterium]|nr:hypothetical protein [Salinivirgaceae bacterium]